MVANKRKGGSMPPLVSLQKMVHASYHNPPREGESEIDGWKLIKGNEWIKFYAKGNDIVIATRGSQTGEDWTDANRRIPFNDLESSEVYKRDERYIKEFKSEHPEYTTYYGVGHSLSGAINDIYLRKGIISEAVSYNPAVETQYFTKQVPNHHRIYMKDDPLYKLMGQFLRQTPEVRASKISTATWLARWTPIGNLLTADQYLQAHDIKQFEGGMRCKKCGLLRKGKGNTASPLHKELFKKKFLEMRKAQTEQEIAKDTRDYHQLKDQMEYIDPADDLEYELAQGEKEAIKKDIIKGKEDLKLFNKHTRINKVGLQNKYEELPAAPTVLPLVKVPRKSPLNPNGKGKSGLTLHAIIVHKPIDLHKAREIARDIMKIKKDKFMRETKSSYRFRNVPKTKFSSFVTKVLNPQVSLVLGHLK